MRITMFALAWCCCAVGFAAEETLTQASWSPPAAEDVQRQVEVWLAESNVDPSLRASVRELWKSTEQLSPEELFQRVTESLVAVDPGSRTLIEQCRGEGPVKSAPQFTWPDALPSWARSHLKLFVAGWLARRNLHDEAHQLLVELDPGQVVDPAALLFYRAAVAQRLMKVDEAKETLERLLENEASLSRRHLALAKLMKEDLSKLEPDSLDEVSRLMDEVRRRLELGRAGQRVRDQEAEIIAKLEKKIKDLEKQRQQQQQQQQPSPAQQAQSPASPAEKSRLPGDISATDEVDPKQFTKQNRWGDLQPKKRQEALQQIGRDLPAHFRETVEEYFKRLAQDGNDNPR